MPETESPATLPRVLFVLLAVDAMIVGLIVGSQISVIAGLAAGAAALVIPLVAIPLVIAILNMATGWSRLAGIYPAQAVAGNAHRGEAETLAIRWRWLGYNMCIQWAADDRYLHLRIIPFFGQLSRPMSIPWSEIDFDEAAPPSGRFTPLVPLDTAAGIKLFVPAQAVEAERTHRLGSSGS